MNRLGGRGAVGVAQHGADGSGPLVTYRQHGGRVEHQVDVAQDRRLMRGKVEVDLAGAAVRAVGTDDVELDDRAAHLAPALSTVTSSMTGTWQCLFSGRRMTAATGQASRIGCRQEAVLDALAYCPFFSQVIIEFNRARHVQANDARPVKRPFTLENVGMSVNYGTDRVRFPSPVPVGSRVCGRGEIITVAEVSGIDRPACVADVPIRVVPALDAATHHS